MADEEFRRKRALMDLCKEMFTSNLIGTDFDDVKVIPVKGRNFPQQPGGDGLHVCFSVSWHAIGKLGEPAHKALNTFEPEGGWD